MCHFRCILFLLLIAFQSCAQTVPTNSPSKNTPIPDTVKRENKAILKESEDLPASKSESIDEIQIRSDKKSSKPETDRKQKISNNRDEELMIVAPSSVPSEDTNKDSKLSNQKLMQQQFEVNQTSSTKNSARRSASPAEQLLMDQSVSYYKSSNPNSFESHYYTYLAGHYNINLIPELRQAERLTTNSTDIQKQFAVYYIIVNDSDSALMYIQQLIDGNIISERDLSYSRDLLLSGLPSSTLILHGFQDMLSTYFVQHKQNLRLDVQLLSLDFMQSENYRTEWESQALLLPTRNIIDTAYLSELCALNTNRNLQLSLTIPKDYFQEIKSNCYPLGLTFLYTNNPIDNHLFNERLWNSEWNKETLKTVNNSGKSDWSTNYLPVLITMKERYELEGNEKKVNEMNAAILSIAGKTQQTQKVKKYTK